MSNFDWQHPTVERVIARYTQLDRKATPQDFEQSRSVKQVAEYYAANYEGSFEFMVKMHGVMDNFNKLSNAQASGVINCMMNDYKYQKAHTVIVRTFNEDGTPAYDEVLKAPQAFKLETLPPTFKSLQSKPTAATERTVSAVCSKCGTQSQCSYSEALEPSCVDYTACAQRVTAERTKIVTQVVANGIYTIVLNEKGDYRTLRISDAPDSMMKRKGTQIASYLSAPDNESDKSYTGFAFVQGSDMVMWARFKAESQLVQALSVLLSVDSEKRADFGEAYALESKRCWRCNRLLTVEGSITRGMGAVCASKMGY